MKHGLKVLTGLIFTAAVMTVAPASAGIVSGNF
jgi:hypothetical protein